MSGNSFAGTCVTYGGFFAGEGQTSVAGRGDESQLAAKRTESQKLAIRVCNTAGVAEADRLKYLIDNVGLKYNTADRILKGEVAAQNDAIGKLKTALAKLQDPKPAAATAITTTGLLVKKVSRESLHQLLDEATADPADIKLVAMMLLMFRDA